METVTPARYSEAQRMEMRSLVHLAGEVIAYYWPMRTIIAQNLLHGLEYLEFEQAVQQGQRFLGGRPYLSNEVFRDYVQVGRIRVEEVDAALQPLVQDKTVSIGKKRIPHLDVLRAHLLHGITTPPHHWKTEDRHQVSDPAVLAALATRLRSVFPPPDYDAHVEGRVRTDIQALGQEVTLSTWCDRVLGTNLVEQMNGELIKWCAAFVDEGHAAWTMPDRELSLYNVWKKLAPHDLSGTFLGIPNWKAKILGLPDRPEDSLLKYLEILGLPKYLWVDYLSLQLGAMPGWTGFIKWRAEEPGYEWQEMYSASLVKYLAIRLFYEGELVRKVCRAELELSGDYPTLVAFMQDQPHVFELRRKYVSGHLLPPFKRHVDRLRFGISRGGTAAWQGLAEQYRMRQSAEDGDTTWQFQAWRLLTLAHILQIPSQALLDSAPGELHILLHWLDAFPESQHGPVWLKAFEAGYRTSLLDTLRPNVITMAHATVGQGPVAEVRPVTQGIFCIDVRSESFRRHLEAIGEYETLGFAGFFAIPFRFRPFGSHHATDQCPVLLKPKHVVREVPRAYQSEKAEKHLAGKRFLQTAHQLLYDLKENVITPYVMVEAIGWVYAVPFILKTTFATWYRDIASWLRRLFAPPLATALTVNKVRQEEALEMLAVEQRPNIRRALREQLGLYGSQVSLELIETLRRSALEEKDAPGSLPHTFRQLLKLSPTKEAALMETLRRQYGLNAREASDRLHRITQTGFTLTEQVNFVATNLLLMGLTKNFARLILLCAHGSTSENNPFESALDCGACGGNQGMPNARTFAAMANKPGVRELLGQHGIAIPPDTYFLAGQVDTATDETELFDLEDVPSTHRRQLSQLIQDLQEAGRQNSRERCAQFPDLQGPLTAEQAAREVKQRSLDWSQVRPEWGLSRNAAFIIGRRHLTKGLDLKGRTFLHSYDYRVDPTGKYLQIILTAPGVVVQWISMEHYLSTVDPEVYGSGSKMYHNVTGRIGVMFGTQSDLRVGLPWQTVMDGERPYHEPMRPLYIVEAPRDRIALLIRKNEILRKFFDGRWIHLVALEPEEGTFYHYLPRDGWKTISQPASPAAYERALEQQDDQEDATTHSLVSNKEGTRHE